MKYSESEEMYLETILLLSKENKPVHAVDIAAKLEYAKSSVSRGVKLLREKGYIDVHSDGQIELTPSGYEKASDIYEKHSVLTELFVNIGADKALAEANACRIEHVIDAELFEIIKKNINK